MTTWQSTGQNSAREVSTREMWLDALTLLAIFVLAWLSMFAGVQ